MRRGEVWWLGHCRTAGSNARMYRKVVILSNDAANRSLSWIVVAPVVETEGQPYPSEAVVTSVGARSKVMADLIMVVGKSWLSSRFGELSKADMLAVEDAIKVHLALPR